MLHFPQPKIKLHHLIPKNESCTAWARQVSPGADVSNTLGFDLQAQDAETGLWEPSVPAPAWMPQGLKNHHSRVQISTSPDTILTPLHSCLLHQQQKPKGLGCQKAAWRFSIFPLSFKPRIKELHAAVNSKAKKESKHELSWEAGKDSWERKSNAQDLSCRPFSS